MSTSPLVDRYLAYYTPLVRQFVDQAADLDHPNVGDMPEPFFPAFGGGYESSALRLIVIGQDTRGWGDLRTFIRRAKANPSAVLRDWLDEFEVNLDEWGRPINQFGGFTMAILATIHDQEDWRALDEKQLNAMVDCFAWGNVNAVELYGSKPSKAERGITWDYWSKVREAGEHLDRFRHIAGTLKPHVALVLCRGMNPDAYFEGLKWQEVLPAEGRLRHYHLPEIGVDVFHVPHPQNMSRIEGADYFRAKLKERFGRLGVATPFPEFLAGQSDAESAMRFIQSRAPRPSGGVDKYGFVDWVATELRKRNVFMSVPALMGLMNDHGYRTNYGTKFEGGRGSYRLVSSTYHRLEAEGKPDRAENVAVAFRRPDFSYAYPIDE